MDRFAIGPRLGTGAGGDVFRADDRQLGRAVALKLLRPEGEVARRRARREIAALMALDLPGVVRMLDQMELGAATLVVMEHVAGAPFPGGDGRSWSTLQGPTLALLAVLEGVHAAGLVHRDLKPDNVLVGADGRVTLLDFGLAAGAAVGDRVTRAGGVVGTPRYLAPEQLSGDATDGRADLYALGVMLYEQLAGEPPHPAARLSELWVARLTRDAPPLRARRPDLPEPILGVVDRLLARSPEQRYPSATAVRRALTCSLPRPLPWVGARGPLEAAVARLEQGRGLRIRGASGSGRTRALAELADRLGARAHLLPAGQRPLSSLASGGPPAGGSLAAVQVWVGAVLDAMAREGRIPLADLNCDPWTREALLQRGQGAVVLAAGEAEWVLSPFDEVALQALFHPAGRFWHVPEDAAAELVRRTAGHPARVAAELSAWVAEGLARWEGDGLVLGRGELVRLSARVLSPLAEAAGEPLPAPLAALYSAAFLAWPETDAGLLARVLDLPAWEVELGLQRLEQLGALEGGRPRWACDAVARDPTARRALHQRIALALPRGSASRLRHGLAAGDPERAAEAPEVALAEIAAGRVSGAVSLLRAALRLVQAEGHDDVPLLQVLVPVLLSVFDAPSRRHLRYELARANGDVSPLIALVQGWTLAQEGRPREALTVLDGLVGLDGRAERSRLAARAAAAQQLPVAEHEAIIIAQVGSIPEGDPVFAQAQGWLGLLAYRRREFAAASRLHQRAAALRPDPAGRVASLLNAANAALEDCDLDGAMALAAQAGAQAAALRDAFAEARAAVIARLAAHRARQTTRPDAVLVDDVAAVGAPWLEGTIAAAEAALAWRLGELEDCRNLANRATACFQRAGLPPARLYARAVAVAAGEGTAEEAQALVAEALVCPLPEVGLDVLALLVGRVGLPEGAQQAARCLAEKLPRDTWNIARGVCTVTEALGKLGVEV